MNRKLGFKMKYSSATQQTAPLYQEITKSVDKDGNIVTTTSVEGTEGTPGYTIPGKPAVLPKPSVVTPPKYDPTGPGESQADANKRWKQYLIDNPPTPPPPPNPGGDTPGNIDSNDGQPAIDDIVVPAVEGTPGTSSSTIKKAPPKPVTGTLSQSIDNKFKSKGSLSGPDLKLNLPRPNLRPVGRALANVALLPFDLIRGVFNKSTCPGGCNKQKFGESIGVLGGRQSISSKLRNRKL